MAKRRKDPSLPRQERRPTRPDAAPEAGLVDQLRALLDSAGWADGHPLPPLPADADALLAQASPVLYDSMPARGKRPDTLLSAATMGYAVLGYSGADDDDDSAPGWLRSTEQPFDPLDLCFFGVGWPQTFRNPAEFGNARQAWLALLEETRHGRDVARLVAATLAVSDELEDDIDSYRTWLGVLLRMQQTQIGTRPLSAQLMPRRALDGHRSIFGPSLPRLPEPAGSDQVTAFASSLSVEPGGEATPLDALRHGLALLCAALLTEVTTAQKCTLATGPLYAATDPSAYAIGVGPKDLVPVADEHEAELNELPAHVEHPHATVGEHEQSDVLAALDALDAHALLGALRMGTATHLPPGTALRQSKTWATGLPLASPLVPVTDALFAAIQADPAPSGLDLLARLLAVPEAVQTYQVGDGAYMSGPGFAVARLAMDAGATQVRISERSAQALDPSDAGTVEEQARLFEEKFGRPPGPDDPLFFDPDAEEPSELSVEQVAAAAEEAYRSMGLSDYTIRAMRLAETDPPVTGRYEDPEQQRDWEQALVDAAAELGLSESEAAEKVEHDLAMLQVQFASMLLQRMLSEPETGTAVVTGLREAVSDLDDEGDVELAARDTGGHVGVAVLANQLRRRPHLVGQRTDTAGWDPEAAATLAGQWADADLAAQVRELAGRLDPEVALEWSQVPAAACLVAAAMPVRE